ncbi:peroxidase [Planoprotostelium fungivorum]|uniref:Peroxidase n=1 Tax=Planoprotostelium fungivorum TaxID=1890364 RepID=A0A2P6NRY4_9EUKA|nr:peroxidase [Planoprotostelium fungivorum]
MLYRLVDGSIRMRERSSMSLIRRKKDPMTLTFPTHSQFIAFSHSIFSEFRDNFPPGFGYGEPGISPKTSSFSAPQPPTNNMIRKYHTLLHVALITIAVVAAEEYRTYNGSGNNLNNPVWGSAQTPLLRYSSTNSYKDGLGVPIDALPSARFVSNTVFYNTTSIPSPKGLSDFATYWGQFIDHDISMASPSVNMGAREMYNIEIPQGDPNFDPNSSGGLSMSFGRSPYVAGTGANGVPRQILSFQSSFLDASHIYGTDDYTVTKLRLGFSGLMAQTSTGSNEQAPPIGKLSMENSRMDYANSSLFSCGDHRCNENPGLLSLHSLFVREHNRLLSTFDSSIGDEALFQKARKWVIALIQHITEAEYLPAILGEASTYNGYDPNLDPSLLLEFSTGAFRYGHSEVNPSFNRLDSNGFTLYSKVDLFDSFYNPTIYQDSIDTFFCGMAYTPQLAVDVKYPDVLRNFLFGGKSGSTFAGHDLIAMNIQRGRDHGLPLYNDIRQAFGLPRRTSFSEVSSDPQVSQDLSTAYNGNIDLCETYVCGIAEDHYVNGTIIANVGETFRTIMREQYRRLREGDRFYYLNPDQVQFTSAELAQIRQTTLSMVIERNTDPQISLQCNVMVLGGSPCVVDDGSNATITTDGSTLQYSVRAGSPGTANPSFNTSFDPSYSWYVNGKETPVLYMVDGWSYTFDSAEQSSSHGFIITSGPNQLSTAPYTYGTKPSVGGKGSPLVYTPNITRDGREMWYSCNQHQSMGNKIFLLDARPMDTTPTSSSTSTSSNVGSTSSTSSSSETATSPTSDVGTRSTPGAGGDETKTTSSVATTSSNEAQAVTVSGATEMTCGIFLFTTCLFSLLY